VRYVLAPRAVAARARVVAASGIAVAVAPAWVVVVLAAQLGLVSSRVALAVAGVIAGLGLVRGFLVHGRAKARLTALAIEVEGEDLRISSAEGEIRVPTRAITRVTEVDGAYGGLRIETAGHGLPPRFEVPRGGDAFGELRSWLAERAAIVRARRRGPVARFGLAAAIVFGLSFVPFVVADARGSRLAVWLVLLVAWGAVRALAARI
jgi:hypothetical protein